MKILVTGANGYLGKGIVKQLLDDGFDVVAADIETEDIDSRAKRISANLFEAKNPYVFFDKPEVLLHLAWRNGFVHNHESHISDLKLHYKFLKDMAESDITRIAVMGSMHEIGFFEGSIKPDTPANPQSLYGISKNALRQLTQLLCGQNCKKFQWIRGFYIVGNTERGCSVFSKIIQAEKRGDEMFPFTSGQNQWDFLDYDDFCAQVAKITEQEDETGIINACSGRPERLAERAQRFIDENHCNIKLAYGTFPDRPYDSKAVWGDDTVIRRIMEKNEKAI